MPSFDAVVIGGGPAGLTAGLYLGRANRRVVLLEKAAVGGPMLNYELIENYPGFSGGISGAKLASELLEQASKYSLRIEQTEAVGIELYASSRWVACADRSGYMTRSVIIAGGGRPRKLNIPGEAEFLGKGVSYCAFCDGNQFRDRIVAVCGGGDAGITGALYLANIASQVIVIEAKPELTASAILRERATSNPKLVIRTSSRVEAIAGDSAVEAIKIVDQESQRETAAVSGIVIYTGLDFNTDYLNNVVPLDDDGRIIVDNHMQTEIPYIFAAGDIRSGSPGQIISAAGDGANAAISAEKYLQTLA